MTNESRPEAPTVKFGRVVGSNVEPFLVLPDGQAISLGMMPEYSWGILLLRSRAQEALAKLWDDGNHQLKSDLPSDRIRKAEEVGQSEGDWASHPTVRFGREQNNYVEVDLVMPNGTTIPLGCFGEYIITILYLRGAAEWVLYNVWDPQAMQIREDRAAHCPIQPRVAPGVGLAHWSPRLQ